MKRWADDLKDYGLQKWFDIAPLNTLDDLQTWFDFFCGIDETKNTTHSEALEHILDSFSNYNEDEKNWIHNNIGKVRLLKINNRPNLFPDTIKRKIKYIN